MTRLATGVAELLAAAAVGEWLPGGQRTGTPVPWITLGNMPETPDQVICLTPYSPAGDSAISDTTVSLQIRVRGDRAPLTAFDLQDAIYEVLHARRRTVLGTSPNQVIVAQVLRRNLGQLGMDSLSRQEWVSTYDVSVNRLTAAMTVDA